MNVTLNINDQHHLIELSGNETLLEVLRDRLTLTGTKTACQESECGTCTCIVDGKAVLSCITLAATLENKKITTIEGLARGDALTHVQQAFIDHGSSQCGFCIPGIIMSATALLERNSNPTQEDIEYALDGNICRCAGYPKIFEAIHVAARKIRGT